MQNSKIILQKDLPLLLKQLAKQKKKIVTYNGSFDFLHMGHVHSIHEAKQQGDVLFLLLNSDRSIKKYKSSKRPIVPENARAEVLAALMDVDYVVLFDEINPKKILSLIKPAIHCNGSDWGENCIERSVVEGNGGKMHILHWEKGYSTSGFIEKMIDVYKKPLIKAVFLDRDGTINDNKKGYIHTKEDFVFLPGVIQALQQLSKTEYKIMLLTNQSGIGRKLYTQKEFQHLTAWMLKHLQKNHVRIDHIYYCPHAPQRQCNCRKPKIGLLMQAVKDFDISLSNSWLVGDDMRDVVMAREANLKVIKLGEKMDKVEKLEPNVYAKNLLDAVSKILK